MTDAHVDLALLGFAGVVWVLLSIWEWLFPSPPRPFSVGHPEEKPRSLVARLFPRK